MSNTSKLVTVIVLIVVALGAWWYLGSSSPAGTQEQVSGNPPVQTGTQSSSGTTGSTVSAAVSTDTSLQQAASGVDTQLGGLNSDTASADQGLSSQ